MATYPSPTLQNLTVNGTATLTDVSSPAATITGGTIDGTPIGATAPAAVHATTINSTGAATLASVSTASATLTGGTVDGVTIGGTTPEAVHATDLISSGTVSGTGFTDLLSPYPTSATLAASGGSALVGFIQNGTGAVARTVLAREQDTLHAADFGVSASNSDNQAGLEAVFAEAATLVGADILLPPGVLSHSGPLVISSRNVRLIGAGGNSSHSGGTNTNPGTCLYYTGATTGIDHLTFTSVSGASNQKQHGGGLRGVWLDGNLKAARGLVVATFNGGYFEDIYSQNHTSTQFEVTIFSGTLAEGLDSQGNCFLNCTAYEYLSSGDGWVLDGGTGGNASFNIFMGCGALHNNGVAWRLKNCDNNFFVQTRAYKTGSGSGYAMEMQGSTATYSCARANRFYQLSANSAIIARGTTSYAVASYGNSIFMLDKENSTPDPTIETGAQLSWETNLAVGNGEAKVQLAVAANETDAANARSAITNESLHVRNNSSAHAVFDGGAYSWSFNIDTNGNWRWQGPAGKYLVPYNDVYFAAGGNANFNETSTTATAGTGGAPPSQVVGYIIVKVGGVDYKVPYYGV